MKSQFKNPTDGRYLERSEVVIEVTFIDSDSVPSAPGSLDYRIDDPDTGEELLASTTLTPAEMVTITVTPDQNAVTNRNIPLARRQVTLRGDNQAILGRKLYTLTMLRGLG